MIGGDGAAEVAAVDVHIGDADGAEDSAEFVFVVGAFVGQGWPLDAVVFNVGANGLVTLHIIYRVSLRSGLVRILVIFDSQGNKKRKRTNYLTTGAMGILSISPPIGAPWGE